MVSCRTVVPFNGQFSSNLLASGFGVINCGPSHTAIWPSCNWWQLLATLHSALFSQPDIKPRSLHSAVPCGFRTGFSYANCLHFSYHPHHLKKTQCRQWSMAGGDITLCHTVSAIFHKCIQLNASLVQTRKHSAHNNHSESWWTVPCVVCLPWLLNPCLFSTHTATSII